MNFVPAPAHLAPWVLGVSVLRAGGPVAFALPAHALATLTVVLQGQLSWADAPSVRWGAGALWAAGSATQARLLTGSADLVCASLLCRASVLPLLTGEPAHVFSDGEVPVQAFGRLDLEAMCRMPLAGADLRVAEAFFAMVAQRLRHARALRASAARFGAALAGWQALAGPPEGWSSRQWQRACQAELGVTPKLLQRLARLHASVRAQQALPPASWAEHALRCGFYDQAHMAREYRLLAGVTPGRSLAAAAQAPPALQLGATQVAPRFFSA